MTRFLHPRHRKRETWGVPTVCRAMTGISDMTWPLSTAMEASVDPKRVEMWTDDKFGAVDGRTAVMPRAERGLRRVHENGTRFSGSCQGALLSFERLGGAEAGESAKFSVLAVRGTAAVDISMVDWQRMMVGVFHLWRAITRLLKDSKIETRSDAPGDCEMTKRPLRPRTPCRNAHHDVMGIFHHMDIKVSCVAWYRGPHWRGLGEHAGAPLPVMMAVACQECFGSQLYGPL